MYIFHLPDCQPAVRPSCISATAPVLSHNKDNQVGFTKLFFRRTSIHCAMMVPSFLYQLAFHLQVNYRKMKNQTGVNKCITLCKVSYLCNQHNYRCACWLWLMPWLVVSCQCCTPKQIDLTSVFATTVSLFCQHVIACMHVNKQYIQTSLLFGASAKCFKNTN